MTRIVFWSAIVDVVLPRPPRRDRLRRRRRRRGFVFEIHRHRRRVRRHRLHRLRRRHELLFSQRSSSSMSIARDGVALSVCPSARLARPIGRVLVGRARKPPQMGPGPPATRNAHILTWDMKGNRHFFDPLKTSGFWRLRLGAVRRVRRVVEIAIVL